MTSKIATVANLALHVFQQHSLRTTNAASRIVRCNDSYPTGTQHSSADSSTDLASSYYDSTLISQEALQKLTSSVRLLSPKDIGFDIQWVSDSNVYAAPVAYVHITENETFSMGIFILRPGSRIPLHDHPGMYGILRVIYGSLRCRSFSRLQNIKPTHPNYPKMTFSEFSGSQWQLSDLIVAKPHHDVVLTPDSQTQVLAPNCGNLHEITPVDGSAVFLDILAPPYDHDLGTRECKFYKEVDLSHLIVSQNSSRRTNGSVLPPLTVPTPLEDCDTYPPLSNTAAYNDALRSPVIYLVETNQPNDYWCESAEYVGPSVV